MVGERIRALRRARGWRQADLATRAGLSIGMISHLEAGNREPSTATLQGIADAFGVSPGLLLDQQIDQDRLVEIATILEGIQYLEPPDLEVVISMIDALRSRQR